MYFWLPGLLHLAIPFMRFFFGKEASWKSSAQPK